MRVTKKEKVHFLRRPKEIVLCYDMCVEQNEEKEGKDFTDINRIMFCEFKTKNEFSTPQFKP